MRRNSSRSLVSFQFLYLIKPIVVVTPYGSHQPVPEQEIQPIITFEVLVVLVMIHRGVYPFAQPMPAEPLGVEFPSKVSIYIINYREEEEDEKVQFVYWDREKKDNEYPHFDDRFQRMEGVSGPG